MRNECWRRGLWVAGFLSLLGCGQPGQGEDQAAEQTPLVEGKFGQALDSSRGGHIAAANAAYRQVPLTVECWFQWTNPGQSAVLIAHEGENSGTHWGITLDRRSQTLQVRLPGYEPGLLLTTTKLQPKQWYHLALVLQAEEARLYLGAKLIGSEKIRRNERPTLIGALAVGTRIDDRRPSPVLLDDLRISSVAKEILAVPEQPLVKEKETIALFAFDESEADYLARWTPGGETNQRSLPYPHRFAEYEFEKDPDWVDNRWQQTDKGPFLTHSNQLPGHQVHPKNMTLFLGKDKQTTALVDLGNCGIVAGLTQSVLQIDQMRFGLLRKPRLTGELQFTVDGPKLWRRLATVDGKQTLVALEAGQMDYQGLYLHDDDVLLEYQITGSEVLEQAKTLNSGAIQRRLDIAPLKSPVVFTPMTFSGAPTQQRQGNEVHFSVTRNNRTELLAVQYFGKVQVELRDSEPALHLPAGEAIQLLITHFKGTAPQIDAVEEELTRQGLLRPLSLLKQPGGKRWGEPLVTKGQRAENPRKQPWVIDTITIPFENPHQALFYITGLGFFDDGSAAVCTAHGDVWLVKGLDESLSQVTWQRFATGMYQPLGLQIVDGKVIVLGRDQLTRLHDLNGDGEADHYETFNNDLVVVGRDHAFAMRLERDAAGNFYFFKAGDYDPHGSRLLKLSADGQELSVYARGFRHPYGMGMGPNGELTAADNEGNWVPTSKIDLIQPDKFYGFLGSQPKAPPGLKPERPLCYIPKVADNSAGGQTWVTSRQWGPYHPNGMLHFSWGRCTLHAVLQQAVGDTLQGATVQFPDLTFLSGPGEGRFHPHDGQLYVIGLDGWQTGAIQDGCFQRVRYTGEEIRLPRAWSVHENGIRLEFTQPLDEQSATNPANWQVQQWNYVWQSTYGSFHYSPGQPGQIGHDLLEVREVQLLPDGKSVLLNIPGLQPVDQIQITTDIQTRSGHPLRFNLYGTINALAPAW